MDTSVLFPPVLFCKSVFFYRSSLLTAFVEEVVLVNENIFKDGGFKEGRDE